MVAVSVHFEYPLNEIIVNGVYAVDSFSIKHSMGAILCVLRRAVVWVLIVTIAFKRIILFCLSN